MKKAKLRKDNRPPRRGFFEQKYVDIYRHGDMLVFKDTSEYSPRKEGEYVDNLRFVCFEDSRGARAIVDIQEGRNRSYAPYTTVPEDDDDPETLLNRIEYLEEKVRQLEDEIVNRE